MSAILLTAILQTKEAWADLLLFDEWKARRYGATQELSVIGCIGIPGNLFSAGHLADLREAYIPLLAERFRIGLATLRHSLMKFKLPPP